MIIHFLVYYYSFHIFLLRLVHQFLGEETPWFGFPFYTEANENYYRTWLLMLLFGNIYSSVVLFLSPARKRGFITAPLRIEVRSLILIASALLLFNLWLWRDLIYACLATGTSGYDTFKRGENVIGKWYPLSCLSLLWMAQMLFLSLAQLLGIFESSRTWKLKQSVPYLVLLVVSLLVSFFFFSLMGDRVSSFYGLLFMTVLFSADLTAWKRMAMFLIISMVVINSIIIMRTRPQISPGQLSSPAPSAKVLVNLPALKGEGHPSFGLLLKKTVINLFQSGESISPFSLQMIFDKNIPSFDGGSLRFFFTALIPRVVREQRPMAPEVYYSKYSGISAQIGSPLHYAADWYMNFQILGILLGAVLLGLFHGFLYKLATLHQGALFAFGGMIACFPVFLRTPLGFKETFYVMFLSILIYFLAVPSSLKQPFLLRATPA